MSLPGQERTLCGRSRVSALLVEGQCSSQQEPPTQEGGLDAQLPKFLEIVTAMEDSGGVVQRQITAECQTHTGAWGGGRRDKHERALGVLEHPGAMGAWWAWRGQAQCEGICGD